MVVNRHTELRGIIRDYLRVDGYTNVVYSENGRSALARIRSEPPNLVIADYDLSELDGLELLKAIRKDKALKDIPLIMTSTETEQHTVAQIAEARVNAYVIKPFSHQTLIAKVDQVLDRLLHPDQAEELGREAEQLIESGRWNEALEKYRQALDAAKHGLAAIHYKMGRAHEKLEQPEPAEQDYHEALDVYDNYVNAYDALGALKMTQGSVQDAANFLRRGSSISPHNADRQHQLGEALLETGDAEGAEKAFKAALNLDPTKTHLFNRLGITQRRQGKYQDAERYFLKAVEATGDDENLFYNLSRVYLDMNQPEQAAEYLRKALAINSEFTEAAKLLAKLQTPASREAHDRP
jgi:two-component system chemotaxis response regulator CheY